MAKLTPMQERFVSEFLVDLNGTQAAIRAGFSPKTARQQSTRLLTNVAIAEAIAKARQSVLARTKITQAGVLDELHGLAHSSVTHYQVNDVTGQLELTPGAPPNAMSAVSSIKYRTRTERHGEETSVIREVEFKLWDKPSTLKLAGRHVATPGFFEKVEVTGKNGGPIQTADVTDHMTTDEKRAELSRLLAEGGGVPGGPPAAEPKSD